MRHAGVAKVLDTRSAQSIASLDRYGHLTPVSEIGRSVGGRSSFRSCSSRSRSRPTASRWPHRHAEDQGHRRGERVALFPRPERAPLTLARRATTATLPERGTAWNDAEVEFARWVGAGVAQLFYDHQRGSEPPPWPLTRAAWRQGRPLPPPDPRPHAGPDLPRTLPGTPATPPDACAAVARQGPSEHRVVLLAIRPAGDSPSAYISAHRPEHQPSTGHPRLAWSALRRERAWRRMSPPVSPGWSGSHASWRPARRTPGPRSRGRPPRTVVDRSVRCSARPDASPEHSGIAG